MRTIIDLSDEQLAALRRLCARHNISRAEAIRRAVTEYLAQVDQRDQAFRESFGAWRDKDMPDAVEFVRSLREEWER
jgi:hypothetical protein